jgi:hypothetical protein
MLLALLLILLGCAGANKDRPPGRFGDCYDRIKEDMTEAEVATILADYPKRYRRIHKTDTDGMRARYLKRTSTHFDHYDDTECINELHYFFIVYYDDSNRVVGKSWSDHD